MENGGDQGPVMGDSLSVCVVWCKWQIGSINRIFIAFKKSLLFQFFLEGTVSYISKSQTDFVIWVNWPFLNWQSKKYVSFQHMSTPNHAAFQYTHKYAIPEPGTGPWAAPVANKEEDGTYTGQPPCVTVCICATIPSFWYHCKKNLTTVAIHKGLVIDLNRVFLYYLRNLYLFLNGLKRIQSWVCRKMCVSFNLPD